MTSRPISTWRCASGLSVDSVTPCGASETNSSSPTPTFSRARLSFGSTTPTELPILRSFNVAMAPLL